MFKPTAAGHIFATGLRTLSWHYLSIWYLTEKTPLYDFAVYMSCIFLAGNWLPLFIHIWITLYEYLNTKSHDMRLLQGLEQKHQMSKVDVSMDTEMLPAAKEICRPITAEPWLMVPVGWGHGHVCKAQCTQRALYRIYCQIQSIDKKLCLSMNCKCLHVRKEMLEKKRLLEFDM